MRHFIVVALVAAPALIFFVFVSPLRLSTGAAPARTAVAVATPRAAAHRRRKTVHHTVHHRVIHRHHRAHQPAGSHGAHHGTRPAGQAVPQPAGFNPAVPSATVVIPRLGIQAPVYERGVDSSGHLPIAPGYGVTHYHFSGVLGEPGNYVIYGHDDIEGSIFRYLPNMQVGDRVTLYSQGHRYVYRVTGSSVVSPYDVAVLDPTSAATLTMISCTPWWVDTQRIVVKGVLIGESSAR